MQTRSFDLTPEQKRFLLSLSEETGKDISALIADALDKLREDETAYLMSSPANVARLRESAKAIERGEYKSHKLIED